MLATRNRSVMLFLNAILLIQFFFTCYAQEKRTYVSGFVNESHRVKERQEDQGYSDQCRFVKLWKGQLGYVNVLLFLDASWHYSYRQAVMLRLLKKRLERANLTDIWFFVVIVPSDVMSDKTENEVEIEAWREISSLESQNFLNLVEMQSSDYVKDTGTDIIVVQDNPDLGIWEKFHASKDQVIIVDRCGRLTYQVIVPWSILYFPYVKAAILSTYKDDPCGPCDKQSTSSYSPMEYEDYLLGKANVKKKLNTNEYTNFPGLKNTVKEESKSFPAIPKESIDTLTKYNDKLTTDSFMKTNENYVNTVITNVTVTSEKNIDSETALKFNETFATNIEEKESTSIMKNITSSNFNIPADTSGVKISTSLSVLSKEKLSDLSKTSESDSSENCKTVSTKSNDTTNNDYATESISFISEKEKEEFRKKSKIDWNESRKDEEVSSVDNSEVIGVSDSKQQEMNGNENDLPIRIIMRAPHLHRGEGTLKKYMYLILKTGNTEYHDHFENITMTSPLNEVTKQETFDGERSNVSVQTKHEDQKVTEYIYNQDESPGLYGEVYDYWKNYVDSDYTDNTQTTEFNTYDDNIATLNEDNHRSDIFEEENDLSKSNAIDVNHSASQIQTDVDNGNNPGKIDEILQSEEESDIEIEDQTSKEEETRRKLVEHYSKLVPWIYYVLNK